MFWKESVVISYFFIIPIERHMNTQFLGIDSRLIKAITELGFTQPTAIQEQAIPLLLKGDKDFIGLAQTGTGKTAAFGLPLIQAVIERNAQGLVLCPTRELCLQITKELTSYAKYIDGFNVVAVYGGADMRVQIKELKRGAHIIVGTPGRLIDHITRKTVTLDRITRVVLDEADQMLDMGFQEDIDKILQCTPADKKVWLFSATMQPKIEKIARTYMHSPLQVTVGQRNSGATNIEHQYCLVKSSDIYHAVRRFIDLYPDMFGIIFCRTKRDVQEMNSQLLNAGYNADALHGDLSQAQRDTVMKKFRNRQLQVLIATDVAARGIDVDGVTHVLHCNLPDDIENYTHRSGRTARAGRSGVSIIIGATVRKIKMIEQQVGIAIKQVSVPTNEQVCQKQLEHFAQTVIGTVVDNDAIKPDMLQKIQGHLNTLTKEDLIERMFALQCGEMLKYYKNAAQLTAPSHKFDVRDRDSYRDTRRDSSYNGYGNRSGRERVQDSSRLFINIGKIDRMNKEGLIKFIATTSSVDGSCVTRVSMQNTRSFFTVEDSRKAQAIVKSLKDSTLRGRRIQIEFEPAR